MRASQPLHRQTMTNEVIQGSELSTYVTLLTSNAVGRRDCLPPARARATESP
jgi:hypothetical protein